MAEAVAAASPAVAGSDVCANAPRSPFIDVRRRSSHARDVDCLYWYRVVNGTNVDQYQPLRSVDRDEMASIIARAIRAAGTGLPPPGDMFDDVSPSSSHHDDIERLAAAGIVRGTGHRRYSPSDPVPRGQATVFLVRAYEYVTGASVDLTVDAFEDDDGHPREPHINGAAGLGLANGTSPTTFEPDRLVDRDEVASFIARLLRRFGSDGVMGPRRPGYESRVDRLPWALRRLMRGSSWRTGCPVQLRDLRVVTAIHHDFSGKRRWGLLVVHEDVVGDVRGALRDIYTASFPIAKMKLVDRYDASDDRSMAANNTSAFNCRTVAGTSTWSQHAHGLAIDVNPVQNPYVNGRTVEPEAGREYLDRSDVRPGMAVPGSALVDAFEDRGWGWGGRWSSAKDYQHFSTTGR